MRYWSIPCWVLESSMVSTSYSSPSLVIMGGGGVSFCWSGYLDGFAGQSRTILKTGWIYLHIGGSQSLYALSPTLAIIGKGPYHLSSSFLEGWSVAMWELSRYTLSPVWYSVHLVFPCHSTSSCLTLPSLVSYCLLSDFLHPPYKHICCFCLYLLSWFYGLPQMLPVIQIKGGITHWGLDFIVVAEFG